MIGENAKRIKKLENVIDLMEGMYPMPVVNGKPLPKENISAVDTGIETGFVVALNVMRGKCDDMHPLEIATRSYDSAFGIYIENVVLAGNEEAEEKPTEEGEAEHGEE